MNSNIKLDISGQCKNCPFMDLYCDSYEDFYGVRHWSVECSNSNMCSKVLEVEDEDGERSDS